VSLYTITESGLSAFYTELAQLHVANDAYSEAVTCYEQAYWLDPSQHQLRYQQVICHAEAEAWDAAVEMLAQLPTEVPEDVDLVAYHTAVAQSYHHAYQITQNEDAKQKVIEACEIVLHLDKKARELSKLLASYQGKKSWWRR
jgi:tetratricopeptide (TPR) repeat protein